MITEEDPPSELAPFYGEVGRALRAATPPDLAPKPTAPRRSWRLELIASVVLIAVALGIGIALQQARKPVISAPAASATPAPSPTPALPAADLAVAGLVAEQVTPLQLEAADGSGKTLIGAYADPARIVLFFRSPIAENVTRVFSSTSVFDDRGWLNVSTGTRAGAPGDYLLFLDEGPQTGANGLATLTIANSIPPGLASDPHLAPSTWAYKFSIKVWPSVSLAAPPFQLGTWKVTVERLEVTPSVINLQAVFAGVSNQDLYQNFQSQPVTLLDAAGNVVNPVDQSAGITVPKQQLNPTTYKNTRVHYQWARPATAATYQLRFTGNGATHTIPVTFPAP
jgi:hypothetical protein